MDRVHNLLPQLQLDPRRIAATSGAIALHVLALMLLLLPGQRPTRMPVPEEHSMIVVPEVRKILKLQPLPRPVAPPRERPRPAPVQELLPVDDTPSPVDVYVPPVPDVPALIESGPASAVAQAFAHIAADVSPAPPYPPQALKRRMTGEVVLRVRVDASGRPLEAQIETSSGWKVLDEAARKFVLARWHFVPATQDGVAIEAQALVPINFVLDR